MKAMQGQAPSPQLQEDITHLEDQIESYSQEKLCYEAQILRVQHCISLIVLNVFVTMLTEWEIFAIRIEI